MRLTSKISVALAVISLNASPAHAEDSLRAAAHSDKPAAMDAKKSDTVQINHAAPGKDEPAPAKDAAPVAAPKDLPTVPPRPSYSVVARINLSTQRMHVTVDGRPLHTWAISSGTSEFPTPRGTFRAQWMSKLWHSRKYDLAPMPHSVFFRDGVAVHGTTSVRLLGQPASHGCVRLAPANAATFYGIVQKHGLARTQVIVSGELPRAPAMARRDKSQPERHAQNGRQQQTFGPSYQYVAVQQSSGASFWGAPVGQQTGYRLVRVR